MSDNQFERLIRFGQRAEQMRDDLDIGFVAREPTLRAVLALWTTTSVITAGLTTALHYASHWLLIVDPASLTRWLVVVLLFAFVGWLSRGWRLAGTVEIGRAHV